MDNEAHQRTKSECKGKIKPVGELLFFTRVRKETMILTYSEERRITSGDKGKLLLFQKHLQSCPLKANQRGKHARQKCKCNKRKHSLYYFLTLFCEYVDVKYRH